MEWLCKIFGLIRQTSRHWRSLRCLSAVVLCCVCVWTGCRLERVRCCSQTRWRSSRYGFKSPARSLPLVVLVQSQSCVTSASLGSTRLSLVSLALLLGWICIAHCRKHASDPLPLPISRRWSLLASPFSQAPAPHCEITSYFSKFEFAVLFHVIDWAGSPAVINTVSSIISDVMYAVHYNWLVVTCDNKWVIVNWLQYVNIKCIRWIWSCCTRAVSFMSQLRGNVIIIIIKSECHSNIIVNRLQGCHIL